MIAKEGAAVECANDKENAPSCELTQIVRTAQKRPLMKGYEIQAANWHRNSNGVSFVFVWMRWWL